MNWVIAIFFPSACIFLRITAILGLILGAGLILCPRTIQKIEKRLSRKWPSSSDDWTDNLDDFRNLEHLFFNHHLITGMILILLPSLFLTLNYFHMVKLNTDFLDNFRTPYFIYFVKCILYPLLLIFLNGAAFFSLFLGVFLMILPQYAFRVIRKIDKPISTNRLKKAIQEEFLLDSFFYKHFCFTGGLLLFLSALLLVLLNRIG
jgi:hypothetical protein